MAALIRIDRARLLSPGLTLLLALLAGCAVPLGPAFQIRHETVTVHYQPGGRPLYYSVRADVKNTGNRTLRLLKMQAPRPLVTRAATPAQGPRESTASSTAAGTDGEMKWLPVPLNPPLGPLRPKKSTLVPFGYVVLTSGDAVLLEPENWFPNFLPPSGLLGKGDQRARKTELDIFVPRGYRALSTGRFRGVRADASRDLSEYRYELRSRDFPPYLLIGRYTVTNVRSGRSVVAFWTRTPLPESCTRTWAQHLATTRAFYRSTFGRLGKDRPSLVAIELPSQNASWIQEAGGDFGSVPGGLWFAVTSSELCAQPGRYFTAADRALAETWFGWDLRPSEGDRAIFAGIQRYASLMAGVARTGTAGRMAQIRNWINEYDALRAKTAPVAPSQVNRRSNPAQWRMAGIQSGLFLIALEDRFGPAALRRALAHLRRSLSGDRAGVDELRSALEQEAGQSLYDSFNRWLGRPEIPAVFRGRYSGGAAKAAH